MNRISSIPKGCGPFHAPESGRLQSCGGGVRRAAWIFPIVALLAAVAPPALVASPAMPEVAVPAVRPAGAPDYADVAYRYGWVRTSFPTVQDAKDALREFHGTRVDWFYPGSHTADPGAVYVTHESQNFIDWCHANGMEIVGAMNTLTTTAAWNSGAPTNGGRYRGDPENAAYVAEAVKWGTDMVDAGVDAIVIDDFFGLPSDRDRQAFNDNVILPIKAYSETRGYNGGIKIAGNNGGFIGNDYVRNYDYDFHYSDNNFIPQPDEMWTAAKAHRAWQSTFLMHPNRSMTSAARRTLLALGYGVGAHLIAPWDEYTHGGARLFEDPADYADLYGFARALGQLGYLNGYEDAAVGGYDLTETRYGAAPPITVTGGSGSLSVFGRAQPGQPNAPVVFHLVESGTPQAATLRLRIPALFGTSHVVCALLTPPAYDATAHSAAAASGDYSALAGALPLSSSVDGDELVITLPTVNPWGALVIAPASGSHSLNIHPASTAIPAGGTQAFSATVVDSSGSPISPQPTITWEVTGGGAIHDAGVFTAGSGATTSIITATAVLEGGEVVIDTQIIVTEALVGYWNLPAADDATLTDLTGNGYDLVGGVNTFNQSSVSIAPETLPNPNSPDYSASGSIWVTGRGSAAQITDNVFKMTRSNSFTFEGWCSVASGGSIRVLGGDRQGNSSPGYSGWYLNVTSSNKLQFYAQFSSGTQGVTTPGEVTGSVHHFAAVWDHDAISANVGVMRLYLDGDLVGTSAPFIPDPYTQSFFAVNGRAAGSDGVADDGIFADGDRLDELRFTYRALHPSQFLNATPITYTDYAAENGGSSTNPTADDNNNDIQDGLEYAFYEALGTGVKLDSPEKLSQVVSFTLADRQGTPNDSSDDQIKYSVLMPTAPPADVTYRVCASSVTPKDPNRDVLATYSDGSWILESGITMESGPDSEAIIIDSESPSTSARRFLWLEVEITGL